MVLRCSYLERMKRFALALFLILSTEALDAQRWLPVLDANHPISDAQQGPDNQVTQMLNTPDGLWIGGWFDTWYDQPSLPLKRFNGETWTIPDSSDFPEYSVVRDLLLWEENIYVAGAADWDPDVVRYDPLWGWQEVGGETDGVVFALCANQEQLFAAGNFTEWDDMPCGIAAFDGLNWEVLHEPLDAPVRAMAYHDGLVFVGGSFTSLDAQHDYVATFVDGAWGTAGNGLNGGVYGMEVLADTLYAEGAFDADLEGNPLSQVVKWHNGAWESVDLTGVVGNVNHLFLFEGMLGVSGQGGSFVRDALGWRALDLRRVACADAYLGQTLVGLSSMGAPDSLNLYHNDSYLYRLHPNGHISAPLSNDSTTAWTYPGLLSHQRPRGLGWHFGPPDSLLHLTDHIFERTGIWFSGWDGVDVFASGDQFGIDVGSPPHHTTYGPFSEVYDNAFADRYLRVWTFSQSDIEMHLASYTSPGYQVPEMLASYPGNGQVNQGESSHLAPFVDQNQNGWYEPELGDYPAFCTDVAAFSVCHDQGLDPTSTHLGIEAVVQLGMMSNEPDLAHAVFVQVHATNRSNRNYTQVRYGVNSYGYYWDDLVGCSEDKDVYYYYHEMDLDDPDIDRYDAAVSFVGFPEAPLENFIYFESSTQGDPPVDAYEFDHYLNGRWASGYFLTSELPYHTNDPDNPGITRFHYPDLPWEEGWHEYSDWGSALPGNRFGVGGHGLDDWPSGASKHTGFWTYAELGDSTAFNTLAKGLNNADTIHTFYQDVLMNCLPETYPLGAPGAFETNPVPWSPYPNPTGNWLSITCDHTAACPTYLELRSLTGTLVCEWEPQEVHPLNVSELAPGVYFLTDPYRGDTFKLLVP